jgi:hypothetical protein
MDGNGRWARRRGLPRTDGHTAGEEALANIVRVASMGFLPRTGCDPVPKCAIFYRCTSGSSVASMN